MSGEVTPGRVRGPLHCHARQSQAAAPVQAKSPAGQRARDVADCTGQQGAWSVWAESPRLRTTISSRTSGFKQFIQRMSAPGRPPAAAFDTRSDRVPWHNEHPNKGGEGAAHAWGTLQVSTDRLNVPAFRPFQPLILGSQ